MNNPCQTHASYAFKTLEERITAVETAGTVEGGGPHGHEVADVNGLQAALDEKGTSNFSGNYSDLSGRPTLFSGVYADLTGKPALFSGAYNDLSGKPTLGDAAAKNVGTGANDVSAGNHTHAGGSGPAVKSGTVNLTAGGTANVVFATPFASVPVVMITPQFANTDTSCTYSARNVTANGFTAGGAGNPAGIVGWIATTAGNA